MELRDNIQIETSFWKSFLLLIIIEILFFLVLYFVFLKKKKKLKKDVIDSIKNINKFEF